MDGPRKYPKRGFASMDPEKRREISRMGGKAVSEENRSFSKNRELAAAAGKKGGESVPSSKRSFSRNNELAASAGRKGGFVSHNKKGARTTDEQ